VAEAARLAQLEAELQRKGAAVEAERRKLDADEADQTRRLGHERQLLDAAKVTGNMNVKVLAEKERGLQLERRNTASLQTKLQRQGADLQAAEEDLRARVEEHKRERQAAATDTKAYMDEAAALAHARRQFEQDRAEWVVKQEQQSVEADRLWSENRGWTKRLNDRESLLAAQACSLNQEETRIIQMASAQATAVITLMSDTADLEERESTLSPGPCGAVKRP
jgi:hypothetical protein